MSALRFCMVTTFYPPASFGGDGIQVQRLSRALVERGHDVTVVHSPEAYRALGGRAGSDRGGDDGVEVIPIDTATGKLSPLATYLSGRPLLTRGRLERVLGRSFDVVHFHNPSLIGGPAVLAMGEGIKLYTAHEQWLICPTHVLWKYQRRVCEAPHCVRCQASYRRPPQLWRATGLLERCVAGLDAIIAPSRTSARLHERFAKLVRIQPLAHFVPQPRSDPTPPRPRAEPYFLYAGRLESIKGVEQLVRAFPAGSHRLVIAGDGPEAESVRRAAMGRPEIEFTGWLDEVELRRLMAGAVAVIVPTQGHESFGLVAVEAFAAGTPAIVRRFGALQELAEDSEAAIAYSSDDELRAAIERLAGEPGLRERLGERARRAYLERWTPEAHMQGYLGLIGELAGNRAAR